ncbi:MAG: glycosyltransferase [Chloroflexi bacterium]|nr:glycosyltransferase [Chloroflexota bacterium]
MDEAIASVVSQSYENWELIVVDTGSEDESRAIIERWAAKDGRIKPVLKSQKMACPPALNLGLAEARGKFIARIKSDDLWRTDRLKSQVDFLEALCSERVGVCGSDAELIDVSGQVMSIKRYPRSHTDCLRAIWYRNPFCHSAVLMRRAALEQCGGYDEAFTLVEDLELWFRIGRYWELCNLPMPLVRYRLWGGSLTSRRLRALAWRGRKVRARAASQLGYHQPLLARAYSAAPLVATLLPPRHVRKLFEWGLGLLSPSAEPEHQLDPVKKQDMSSAAVHPARNS